MELSTIIYYLIGLLIGLLIFYNIVKAAVRNGIREARKDVESPIIPKGSIPDTKPNERQLELQERYNRGEITFDEYRAGWDSLTGNISRNDQP
ncbi:hypothetical protein [Agriterribacter sp.]|uniref:hypothetical protein n=1 Tax=Agriterribacter sp. TaxID=2821509 RepID=UPI002CA444AE|nr:hypothetical protein [Agriterribacter sp.]HRO48077.1 hypothetical protein [Agriterribacter sp.]HRQ16105.1 hypothetical protein [Agriterribacter sp.]